VNDKLSSPPHDERSLSVLVATEVRLNRHPDGSICCPAGTASYSFWQRYLGSFDEVVVVARVFPAHGPPTAARVEGPGVRVSPFPSFDGPGGFAKVVPKAYRAAFRSAGEVDRIIARVPGTVGNVVLDVARVLGRPFALEVVGDPYDVFRPDVIPHAGIRFFQWWFVRHLKAQCRRAHAVAYVTRGHLQERYPTSKNAFSTSYSSIELDEDAFVRGARRLDEPPRPITFVTVGSLEQPYKGVDTLVKSIEILVRKGIKAELEVIGEGRYRSSLETLAESLGLESRIRFLGRLPPGRPIRERLDSADIFLLGSRTEGLPRVVIEAMARALPCVATNVGGTPELLPAEFLVQPDDPAGLAAKICGLADDPTRMTAASVRNLEEARNYSRAILDARRERFYRVVADGE
jgi:glycosyltransferase involved in cell wall biosynthesis